jgi:hypothetical protein
LTCIKGRAAHRGPAEAELIWIKTLPVQLSDASCMAIAITFSAILLALLLGLVVTASAVGVL